VRLAMKLTLELYTTTPSHGQLTGVMHIRDAMLCGHGSGPRHLDAEPRPGRSSRLAVKQAARLNLQLTQTTATGTDYKLEGMAGRSVYG
jgi:hypothetical protein